MRPYGTDLRAVRYSEKSVQKCLTLPPASQTTSNPINQGRATPRRADCIPIQFHAHGIGIEFHQRGVELRWGLGWPWCGVELVTPFLVGIGWHGVRQIFELERMEWRGVASDTGEELERSCANPKQFSGRERGVALDTGEELERNCANPKQFSGRERGVTVRFSKER